MWLVTAAFFGAVAALILPLPPTIKANANLRTLRTFQTGACDGDDLLIECWPNTVISITKVLYGRLIRESSSCASDVTQSGNKNASYAEIPNCTVAKPLQVVEEICKDKVDCNMKPSVDLFKEDPCPGVAKYVDIFYKCRPSTLYTRIVCEGESLKIRCRKTLRIVIYSAWFGSTLTGVPECPQQKRHRSEDCQANYATETVMNICHGRLKCMLTADLDTFENPGCTKRAHLFLKVVYTCVSKDVLQDLQLDKDGETFDYSALFEESDPKIITHDHRERDDNHLQLTTLGDYRSDDLLDLSITTTKEADILSDENVSTDVNCTNAESEQKVIGFISEWIAAYKFISNNKEKFILYLTVSLGAGLLVFLIVLAARLYIQQQQQLKVAKLNISEPLPLSVDEDCSDIDHYDPRNDHSVEVVRYTNTSTVRRQDSDSGPRAPLSHSMNNYYYS